jgi:alpha-N-arabinofuranosidase
VRETERFPNLPAAPYVQPTCFNFRELSEIPLNMMHLRNPVTEDYKFKNGLQMHLNKNDITQRDTVSYLCIRQQHMSFNVQTQMQFTPTAKNECAGLVILQNNSYHYQFVFMMKGKEKILRIVKCQKDIPEILSEAPVSETSVYLKIQAQEQSLTFSYSTNGQNFTPVLENASAKFLNTDSAGGFVGNTIGMYASSNGKTSKEHALFTEFSYVSG